MKKLEVDLNKRYWLFASRYYYANGGLRDLRGSSDILDGIKSIYASFIDNDGLTQDPDDFCIEIYDRNEGILYEYDEIEGEK